VIAESSEVKKGGEPMNEGFDPDVVAKYERDTWSRCADDYANTFAGITGETVPLLIDAAGIRPGSQVLDIGSGSGSIFH
jgi:cyclopropane fatty-acyl-phospholipid synthase-like methyltransferase